MGGTIYMKGIVKWFNHIKGFGFITSDDGTEIFIHRSAVPTGIDINENDYVEYRILTSNQGPKATDIKKITKHLLKKST
jgi:CspA family cold shock protein